MNLLILSYVLCRHYVICTAVASDAGDMQKNHVVLTADFLPFFLLLFSGFHRKKSQVV